MRRVLLVGEQNPHDGDPAKALWPWPLHGSGGRLMQILGLLPDAYLERHDRTNLCYEAWDPLIACNSALAILHARPRDSGVVVLGRKGQAAFGWVYEQFQVHYVEPGLFMLALPHPSGLCRTWNDRTAVERAREAYDALLRASAAVQDAPGPASVETVGAQ